jgi:hypothetical protein
MAKNKDDIVTFLNSAGEEISNDPRWHAKRTLEAAGMQSDSSGTEELHEQLNQKTEALLDKDAEIAELQRQLAAAQANSAGVDDDAEEEDDADDEDEFSKLNGKELKARAKDENVSISGMKTVGEVRAALRAAKAAE